MGIFTEAANLLVQYVDQKARQYTTQAFRVTRRFLVSLLAFAAAGFFWATGLIFLFVSVFFAFTPGFTSFALSALWTGLIVAGIGAVTTGAAFILLRS